MSVLFSFFHGSISKETHPPPSCLCVVYKRGHYKVMIHHRSFAGRNFLGHFLPFKNPLPPQKKPLPHKSKRRRRKTAAGTTAVRLSFLSISYATPPLSAFTQALRSRALSRPRVPGLITRRMKSWETKVARGRKRRKRIQGSSSGELLDAAMQQP